MKPYGCFNSERKSHFWVKESFDVEDIFGGFGVLVQIMQRIEDRSTKSCQYRIEKPNDKRCQGCKK